jgi:hypothetical protein
LWYDIATPKRIANRRFPAPVPDSNIRPFQSRTGVGLAEPLQEGDIRQSLQEGGYIRNAFVIEREAEGACEYVLYLRPSWRRGFLPLRTWQDKSDRKWRDLDRALHLLRRDFGYRGVIPIYLAGDPELARYRALGNRDSPKLDGASLMVPAESG